MKLVEIDKVRVRLNAEPWIESRRPGLLSRAGRGARFVFQDRRGMTVQTAGAGRERDQCSAQLGLLASCLPQFQFPRPQPPSHPIDVKVPSNYISPSLCSSQLLFPSKLLLFPPIIFTTSTRLHYSHCAHCHVFAPSTRRLAPRTSAPPTSFHQQWPTTPPRKATKVCCLFHCGRIRL